MKGRQYCLVKGDIKKKSFCEITAF